MRCTRIFPALPLLQTNFPDSRCVERIRVENKRELRIGTGTFERLARLASVLCERRICLPRCLTRLGNSACIQQRWLCRHARLVREMISWNGQNSSSGVPPLGTASSAFSSACSREPAQQRNQLLDDQLKPDPAWYSRVASSFLNIQFPSSFNVFFCVAAVNQKN